MKLENDKDVLNNSRLTDTLVAGALPDIIEIFKNPIINSGMNVDEIEVKRFFSLIITNLLCNLVNTGNGIKAMLRLSKFDNIAMNENDIKELYLLSCKGATESSFLVLDAYVSRALYREMDEFVPKEYIIKAYGDKVHKFQEIIGDNLNILEKFGIPK